MVRQKGKQKRQRKYIYPFICLTYQVHGVVYGQINIFITRRITGYEIHFNEARLFGLIVHYCERLLLEL